jgi:PLP dependent protein
VSIADRLHAIQERVASACLAAGRPPGSARLLAASKTRSPEDVAAALKAGQRLFGENRGQEMRDKPDSVAALAAEAGLPTPEWHFIGALQRNKVKYVVGRATLVHAVDSLRLGQAISDRVGRTGAADLGVLVEVNVGAEQTKAGVPPGAALELAGALHALPGVQVRGLMTIPPAVERPEDAAPYFARMAALQAEGRSLGLPMDELSMGMSGDFEVAIAHGATIVRVGTAIFGRRG